MTSEPYFLQKLREDKLYPEPKPYVLELIYRGSFKKIKDFLSVMLTRRVTGVLVSGSTLFQRNKVRAHVVGEKRVRANVSWRVPTESEHSERYTFLRVKKN